MLVLAAAPVAVVAAAAVACKSGRAASRVRGSESARRCCLEVAARVRARRSRPGAPLPMMIS